MYKTRSVKGRKWGRGQGRKWGGSRFFWLDIGNLKAMQKLLG